MAAHAEAAIQPDRHRQRKLSRRERSDGLRSAILADPEVRRRQAGDRFTLPVGDGGVHLNQVHPGRKLRISRLKRDHNPHKPGQEEWYNPREPKEQWYAQPWIS